MAHGGGCSPTYWSLVNTVTKCLSDAGRGDPFRRLLRATVQLNAIVDAEPALIPAHPPLDATATE